MELCYLEGKSVVDITFSYPFTSPFVSVKSTYSPLVLHSLQSPVNVDDIRIFIESLSPVQQDLNCFPVANTTTSSFIFLPSSSPEAGYLVVDTLCMVTGVIYSVQVTYTEFSAQGWMLDSVR